MDALILSCGTGGGHDAAGKAVMEKLIERGHHVTMLNPYTIKSEKLSRGINQTYISIVQYMPDGFGFIYKIGDLYRKLPFRSPVYYVNGAMNGNMQAYLDEHPADIVIMPHLFPAEILTNMKLHGCNIPKTMFIATDYTCIPFTEETQCDAYVIPGRDLLPEFAGRGIPKEKLYPIGIPVGGRFCPDHEAKPEKYGLLSETKLVVPDIKKDACDTKAGASDDELKEIVRRRLGLLPQKKYVLIAGGSMGGGKIRKAVEKLRAHFAGREDVELIVVCGSNEKLLKKLKEHPFDRELLMGYTEQMADYMLACDLFITKPGGLSSTEAAACHVPILHTAVIPGCESRNAKYFNAHGLSEMGELSDGFLEKVDLILEDPQVAAQMILCQKNTINGKAAEDICRLAEEMVGKG